MNRRTARRLSHGGGAFNGNQFNYPIRGREYASGAKKVTCNGRISISGN